jgi:hypothetical protein
MVPSFKKGHLLAKKGTSPGCDDVFTTRPKVTGDLSGIILDTTGFWTLIEGEEG